MQKFIKLRAAVHELAYWQEQKNSDENNTVCRYSTNSNKIYYA